jgi:hypothetical protein
VEAAAGAVVFSGCAIVHGETADGPGTHLSGQAGTELGIDDAAREEERFKSIEEAGVLPSLQVAPF